MLKLTGAVMNNKSRNPFFKQKRRYLLLNVFKFFCSTRLSFHRWWCVENSVRNPNLFKVLVPVRLLWFFSQTCCEFLYFNSAWLQYNGLSWKLKIFIFWTILDWFANVIDNSVFRCWKQINKPLHGFFLTAHRRELPVKDLAFYLTNFDRLVTNV